jgi:Zn finger protein HypA/HybF involved in hydrogenase expression
MERSMVDVTCEDCGNDMLDVPAEYLPAICDVCGSTNTRALR